MIGLGQLLTPSLATSGYATIHAAVPNPSDISYCSQGMWNWLTSATCWGQPLSAWQQLSANINVGTSMAAPPGIPPTNLLTTPPATGTQAQQTVNALVNQQMLDQQSLDATQVQPVGGITGWLADIFGSNPNSTGMTWYEIVLLGGLVAVGVVALRR